MTEKTTPELLPISDCRLCGCQMKHVESWALSFKPKRLYHEYHHPHGCCALSGKVWHFTEDIEPRKEFLTNWNRAPSVKHEQTGEPTDSDLKKFGYAAGDYTSPCWSCEKIMDGLDKDCSTCRDCAVKKWGASRPRPSEDEVQLVREALEETEDFENDDIVVLKNYIEAHEKCTCAQSLACGLCLAYNSVEKLQKYMPAIRKTALAAIEGWGKK